MNNRTEGILDVLAGQKEIQIGLDMQDMARLFATIFLAMLLAGLLTRIILPNR